MSSMSNHPITLDNHKEVDIYGKKCAPIVAIDNTGKIIECRDAIQPGNRYAASIKTYKNLAPILEKYSESTDGSLSILIQLMWMHSPHEDEIYLLKADPEYLHRLVSVLNDETKDQQCKYNILCIKDLDGNSVVYDQNEFLDSFAMNLFGFEFRRERKTVPLILTSNGLHF